MNTCKKCGFEGELQSFYSKFVCEECNKKYMRKYMKKYMKKYTQDNVKIYMKEYYKKNKEKILANVKNWNSTESGKASSVIKSAKRRALKLSTEDGTITKESLQQLRELQNNKCYYCECELNFEAKNEVHLDHHIPLSKGGIHSITNVKYTCKSCNVSKSAMMPTSLLLIFGEKL